MLDELAGVLGLLEQDAGTGIGADAGGGADAEDEAWLTELIDERAAARAAKDWARADEIRDILKERGITVKDTPQGVQIVRA
jgi:cysteinyl-tRNA synthetase